MLSANNSSPLLSNVVIISINKLLTSVDLLKKSDFLLIDDWGKAIVLTTSILFTLEEVIFIIFSWIIMFSSLDLKSHLFKTIMIFFPIFNNFFIK